MNIVLIEYRGSGKSTVGRRLAARLRKRFVDTDDLIEEHYNAFRIRGCHDVSVIPLIIPVCESMAAIVLAGHLFRQKVYESYENGKRGKD
jgi:chorismate synthase